ncbi:MAG: type II toxin-antitoxin system VapC family toxin [Gammaproteobacteria bacterium]|nr:type II toxin-antitoxin system VapC family toxin [Gammaproteobacteria bacterium]
MKLLLDTHILLWALATPEKLGAKLREALEDPRNTVLVSSASVWEIEIKKTLGKLVAPSNLGEVVDAARFTELAIGIRHAERIAELPDFHRDPFDRMLVAQALVEDAVLVSRDRLVQAYPCRHWSSS